MAHPRLTDPTDFLCAHPSTQLHPFALLPLDSTAPKCTPPPTLGSQSSPTAPDCLSTEYQRFHASRDFLSSILHLKVCPALFSQSILDHRALQLHVSIVSAPHLVSLTQHLLSILNIWRVRQTAICPLASSLGFCLPVMEGLLFNCTRVHLE